MTLERLGYFVALAERLHFGRAAEQLHISQPALSQQVRRLESELGAALCERTPRGVQLTPAGELLAEEGRRLLSGYARTVERVRDTAASGGASGGTLRVAFTRSGAALDSHDLVARFRAEHPGVTVHTATGWTSWNLAQLRGGAVDAVFVRPPIDEAGLLARLVSRSEMVAVLPSGHRLARRRRVPAADLLAEDALVFWPREQGPGFHDAVLAAIRPAAPASIELVEEPDGEHIVAGVAAGHGVSVLDRTRADQLRRRGVLVRRFTDPVPVTELALAWRTDQANPALERLLAMVPVEDG